jgi:ABC-2 type transport system ATP-binding protein
MSDTAAPPVVEIAELTKVFADFWGRPRVSALNGVSLTVRPGEVFGLLGPNGSGKTTAIKILLGLLFPTRGKALVFGRSPRDVRTKARIGYLPEESCLYPYLDAEETLDFYGRLFKLDAEERKRRIDSLLRLVGLNVEKRRPVREYSKGMARRIGIAQALINDPDLIVLDEPTSGLDPIGNREVKDLILRLKQRGKTILLCSHLLADVEDVCDRIAILYGGRVRKQGSVPELLARSQVTQISAEGLRAETTRRVIDLIRAEEGEKPVSVDHPMTRLEAYFLEVVQEAQAEQAGTAGARIGTAADNFLTAGTVAPPPSPRDALAKLVAVGDSKTAVAAAGPTAEPSTETRTVRSELLVELAAKPATVPATRPSPKPTEPEPDRSVLNRLVKPEENKDAAPGQGVNRP